GDSLAHDAGVEVGGLFALFVDSLVGLVGEQRDFGDVDPEEADAAAGGGEAAGVAADGVELARAQVRGDDSADGRNRARLDGRFGGVFQRRLEFAGRRVGIA